MSIARYRYAGKQWLAESLGARARESHLASKRTAATQSSEAGQLSLLRSTSPPPEQAPASRPATWPKLANSAGCTAAQASAVGSNSTHCHFYLYLRRHLYLYLRLWPARRVRSAASEPADQSRPSWPLWPISSSRRLFAQSSRHWPPRCSPQEDEEEEDDENGDSVEVQFVVELRFALFALLARNNWRAIRE